LKRKNIDIALLQETHLLKADMGRFADRFFHTIAFSSAGTKTKGVAIVVRRSLPVKIATSWADESGRVAIAQIEVHSRKIALISLYAPDDFRKDFYNLITTKMRELTDYSFIVGADFNAVWDPVSDRSSATSSGGQSMATNALKSWANNLDYLFASPQLFQPVNTATLLPIALSDHKGVFCSYTKQFVSGLKEFLNFNVGSVEDPSILWDAIKGFIRSNAILFSSNARKSRSLHLQNLEREFTRLESILQSNFTEQVALQHTIIKKEINNILKQQSEFQIQRTRQKYYFHGAR
uniref:Endonuclease/exonuclease/phosphatase domain-containing protein n=1 Tax=Takifugu rubripes TaxID=31033 RepID=A0A674MSZ3_TAKRU